MRRGASHAAETRPKLTAKKHQNDSFPVVVPDDGPSRKLPRGPSPQVILLRGMQGMKILKIQSK